MATYTMPNTTSNMPILLRFSENSMWGGQDEWFVQADSFNGYYLELTTDLQAGDIIEYGQIGINPDAPETEMAVEMGREGVFTGDIRYRVNGTARSRTFKDEENQWVFDQDTLTNGFRMRLIEYVEDEMEGNYWKVVKEEAPTPPPTPPSLDVNVLSDNAVGFFKEKINAIKGLAKVLTAEDYNANSSNWSDTDPANFNCVALARLPYGTYTFDNLRVAFNTTNYSNYSGVAIVSASETYNTTSILFLNTGFNTLWVNSINKTTMARISAYKVLCDVDIVNDLVTSSTNTPLSANQGKILKGLVDSVAIRGAGAPTTATVGQVGTLYEDTTNGDLYICTDATNPYVWEEVGAGGGGGGPTVVQTTGTSTTDVMSQDAATKLLYPDINNQPSNLVAGENAGTLGGYSHTILGYYAGCDGLNNGNYNTAIGSNARITNGAESIAIGYGGGVETHGRGEGNVAVGGVVRGGSGTIHCAIALGRYSKATRTGEMNIGTVGTGSGFNGTEYRLISGVHDPQSAHDAATKGYVDPTTDSSAPTTATVGRLGEIRIDTTTNTAYMCVLSDSTTPAYEWKQITA